MIGVTEVLALMVPVTDGEAFLRLIRNWSIPTREREEEQDFRDARQETGEANQHFAKAQEYVQRAAGPMGMVWEAEAGRRELAEGYQDLGAARQDRAEGYQHLARGYADQAFGFGGFGFI